MYQRRDRMKVAVTSKGKEPGSEVDPRFGRCRYFAIIDTDTGGFEAVENEGALAAGGAGPQASQTLSRTGARVVISGSVGPKAFEALKAAGIEIITGGAGTVEEVVKKYMKGELKPVTSHSVDSHSGMGGRRG